MLKPGVPGDPSENHGADVAVERGADDGGGAAGDGELAEVTDVFARAGDADVPAALQRWECSPPWH